MTGWSQIYLDLIFQVYGLAFFVLGIVVLVQPRRDTTLSFAPDLGWLAIFGITHGLLEFLAEERLHHFTPWLVWLSAVLLIVSYTALLEFGRRAWNNSADAFRLPVALVYGVVVTGVAALTLWATDPQIGLDAGMRYLVGVPAALLTGAVMLKIDQRDKNLQISFWLRTAALAFIAYGLLSLFIASSDPGLPAWFPTTADFVVFTGFPVQLGRALCAVLATVAFVMLIHRSIKNTSDALQQERNKELQYERKKAEQELQQFKNTLDQTLDCVFMFHADNLCFSYLNEGALQQVGYSREELLNMHPYDIKPEFSELEFREMIAPLVSGEQASFNFETVHQHKDGHRIPVEIFLQYIEHPEERSHFVALVRDITQRKQFELSLMQNEERLNEAQRIAKVGSWELDLRTSELTWSDEIYRIFELDKEQFDATYEVFLKAIHPADRDTVNNAYTDSLLNREPYEIVHRLKMDDGRIKIVRETCESYFADDGNPVRSVGTIQDITELHKAEQETERNRARFEAIFESIPDAIIYADPDRNIRMVNSAAIQLFGYEESELTGKQTRALYSSAVEFKRQGEQHFNADNESIDTPYNVTYRCKNGKTFLGETLGVSVKSSSGEELGHLGVIRDVSERVQVEAILKSLAEGASNIEFTAFLQEALAHMTVLYDCEYGLIGELQKDGKHIRTLAVWGNGELMDNFEYALAGTPCQDVFKKRNILVPEHVSQIYSGDQLLVDMGVESYFGVPLSTSEGHTIGIIAIMSTRPLQLNALTEPVLEVFARRIALELERNITNQELQQYREHLEELVEERTDELRTAQDKLVRKERLATLGQLTAAVSHELRNPLSAMKPSLYVIQKMADKSNELLQKSIQRVDRNVNRCDRIIDELLDFTRFTVLNKDATHFDEWLESVIDEQDIHKDIQIKKDFSLKDVELRVDTSRLRRAVINVLDNACQAMLEDEQLDKVRQGSCLEVKTRRRKQRIEIIITDTGVGMSDDVLGKVFEPLFSTKGFGVGLGMSIVRQIMALHDGGVELDTTEGRGTSVTLWLPCSTSETDKKQGAVCAG